MTNKEAGVINKRGWDDGKKEPGMINGKRSLDPGFRRGGERKAGVVEERGRSDERGER